jgi:hypothetical protein
MIIFIIILIAEHFTGTTSHFAMSYTFKVNGLEIHDTTDPLSAHPCKIMMPQRSAQSKNAVGFLKSDSIILHVNNKPILLRLGSMQDQFGLREIKAYRSIMS